ncbi:glycosyltransferase family 2 protein [Naasia lichenicola]|uniref:Glycosyltransferase family 2 protein n=1 Tax=Naasia lichenicola TaxID=2565933 RepID=A0A4S4FF40_9MICO|nr:glycosyltransferase family 2 protein [Naasia lichenicola]
MNPLPRVGAVVLTQGTRLDDLRAALASLTAQDGIELDLAVVGNGWDPAELGEGLPAGSRVVALPENLGIPAGRNAGADVISGDWIVFLDDDASLPSARFVLDAIAVIQRDPTIGALQPRVDDPTGLTSPRRWIPRIRKGDPSRSSAVFSLWEGAVVLPRQVFDQTGGWADEFFYAHEGIDLAWRVWETGHRAWYAGDLVAHHPVIQQTRHEYYWRLNARNRVWLARRNLPAPLIPLYVASWTGIQALRFARNRGGLRPWIAGWLEGWRADPGVRRPLRWRTILRMTLAGRPPIV